LEVHNCVVLFTSHGKLHEFGVEKPISWAKPAHFDFLTINFTVWSHMLSTGVDVLSKSKILGTHRAKKPPIQVKLVTLGIYGPLHDIHWGGTLELWPSCVGTSKQGRASGPTLLIYITPKEFNVEPKVQGVMP
jgi:hypothetical protein